MLEGDFSEFLLINNSWPISEILRLQKHETFKVRSTALKCICNLIRTTVGSDKYQKQIDFYLIHNKILEIVASNIWRNVDH